MSKKLNNLVEIIKKLYCAFSSRSFMVISLTIALAVIVSYISANTNVFYIRDGESVDKVYTLKSAPEEILKDQGVAMMAFDTAKFTEISSNKGEIHIRRAFPVTLKVDGLTHSHMVTDDITIGQLLAQQEITLGVHDTINLPLNFFLAAGDHIIIERVSLTTTVVEEEIPYEIKRRQNSLLRPGRSSTLVQGESGKRTITYADRVVDGVLQEREIVSNVIDKHPLEGLVLSGGKGAISDLNFGYKMDASGKPIGYSYVLENQIATAYSASPRANRGASGQKLFYGYAAVRPDQIPYGTKMYITSADNSFVYGYCIAADTGTALMDGIIDIDLFYETFRESQLNGRKIVNIYVLPN